MEGRLSGLVEGHSSDSCDRNDRCVTDLTSFLISIMDVDANNTGFLSSHHLHCNSVHSANCATPQLTRLSCRRPRVKLGYKPSPPFTTHFGNNGT